MFILIKISLAKSRVCCSSAFIMFWLIAAGWNWVWTSPITLRGCLNRGPGVWEERASAPQQRRWEEGKWAMWRKPEGEWWSVRQSPATFPDPPVGPLCYLYKMGGIEWPAVPLGWVADPLAREESQPLLPSSLQWERLFWFLSSLSHRQTWEAQFIWERVRGK